MPCLEPGSHTPSQLLKIPGAKLTFGGKELKNRSGSLMARNLGQGLPKRSWEVTKVGMILVYGAMTIFATLRYIFNPTFARFASTDPLVQHQIIHIRFVSAFGMFMCGGLYLCADLICRQGWPEIVFKYLSTFNWFIGLPTSFFLTPILGIRGIWIGLTVGYTLAHAVLLYYLLTTRPTPRTSALSTPPSSARLVRRLRTGPDRLRTGSGSGPDRSGSGPAPAPDRTGPAPDRLRLRLRTDSRAGRLPEHRWREAGGAGVGAGCVNVNYVMMVWLASPAMVCAMV